MNSSHDQIKELSSRLSADDAAARSTVFEQLIDLAERASLEDDGQRLQDCIEGLCHAARSTSDSGLCRAVVDVIVDRLRLRQGESEPRWAGRYFDLRELRLDQELWDFSDIVVGGETWLHLDLGEFRQCEFTFDRMRLEHEGTLLFGAAKFIDTTISFLDLRQSGGALSFRRASFSSSCLFFDGSLLTGGSLGLHFTSIDDNTEIRFNRPARDLYVAIRGAEIAPGATVCLPWVEGDERVCLVHRTTEGPVPRHTVETSLPIDRPPDVPRFGGF